MGVLKTLLVPLNPASLLFVGVSGLTLAMIVALARHIELIAIFPAIFLVMWLFKYAYVMLEHVANGAKDAPVVAVEMLGPMELRPWVQIILVGTVYFAVQSIGGKPGTVLGIAALLLLPASVGALGTSGTFTDAFNPVALWRMLRGLSYYYPFVLIVIAAIVFAATVVSHWPLWPAVRYALLELAILAIFSFIGGAIYARREALGYEPRRSPERALAKEQAERRAQRQRMLDEVHQCVNSRHYLRAGAPIETWLNAADAANINEDVALIASAATQWHNQRGIAAVMRILIGWLVAAKKPTEAFQVLRVALENHTDFTLESEPHTLVLAQYANTTGQPQFALGMLSRFEQQHPATPLSDAAKQFRRQLAVHMAEARNPPHSS